MDPKDVMEDMTKTNSEKDTFMADMDKFEAEISGTDKKNENHDNHGDKKTPQQGDEETGVFHFNPNITFGGSDDETENVLD